MKIPYSKQKRGYYCGPASLQMVFGYFRHYISQDKLAEKGRTRHDRGTSRAGMIRVARENGFHTYAQNDSDLPKIADFLKRRLPVIVNFIEPSDEEGHYAVVSGLSGKQIILNDPWNGKNFKLDIRDFLERWRGGRNSRKWLLVISKTDLQSDKR